MTRALRQPQLVSVLGVGALTQYQLPVLFGLDLNLPANKAPFDLLTDFAMFGAVVFETLVVASQGGAAMR